MGKHAEMGRDKKWCWAKGRWSLSLFVIHDGTGGGWGGGWGGGGGAWPFTGLADSRLGPIYTLQCKLYIITLDSIFTKGITLSGNNIVE